MVVKDINKFKMFRITSVSVWTCFVYNHLKVNIGFLLKNSSNYYILSMFILTVEATIHVCVCDTALSRMVLLFLLENGFPASLSYIRNIG